MSMSLTEREKKASDKRERRQIQRQVCRKRMDSGRLRSWARLQFRVRMALVDAAEERRRRALWAKARNA